MNYIMLDLFSFFFDIALRYEINEAIRFFFFIFVIKKHSERAIVHFYAHMGKSFPKGRKDFIVFSFLFVS